MREGRGFVDQLESLDWARAEFELASLGDERLDERVVLMAGDFAQHPGAPIPQACQTKSKTSGAYRLIENDDLKPEALLAGHQQANLKRLASEPVILAPTDTTSFNYAHLPRTTGLSAIGPKAPSGQRGLWLHSTQAFTPSGLPLGIIASPFWERPLQKTDKRSRQQRPFPERESYRWWQSYQACRWLRSQLPPATRLVNLTDMEGDIYEVFAAALALESPRAELLIRSYHNRRLEEDPHRCLWEQLADQPLAGMLEVRVPRHEQQPPRLASLQIRFCQVLLAAPRRKADQPPLRLWAVEARELRAPKGAKPILWWLLTTLPVTTAEEAIEKVRWYAVRWSIEVFHKILKSVCRPEALQMETGPRLKRMITLDLLVAWRVQVLTLLGRQYPNLPASDYFSESEWKALHSYIHPKAPLPNQAPGLGEMMCWIGQFGGWVKCKSSPYPGPITLARGLARLSDLTAGWRTHENTRTNCV